MERVVTINLNGNPYQLDEPAYDALRAYLARAEATLAANPDAAEIIRDLEQAIADKIVSTLGAHKTVANAAELERILTEMGPVDGEENVRDAQPAADAAAAPKKRLYRIKEGANIAGICTGLAAYFDLDVNIIRVLFIVLAVLTSGAFAIVYTILMFVIPSANTSEEWAAAHGVPFNAQDVIDRAKKQYADFAEKQGKPAWRQARRQWREWRRANGVVFRAYGPHVAATPAAGPVSYLGRVIAGLFAVVLSLISAALAIGFIIAIVSLFGTGMVLNWSAPADMPIWLVIVILAVLYAAISLPVRLLRQMSFATMSGAPHYQRDSGGETFGLVLLALIGAWFAYTYVPEAREAMQQIPHRLNMLMLEVMH